MIRKLYQSWLAYREENKKRYWQVGTTFGGVISLGYMSKRRALKQARKATGKAILYVDVPKAFIAVGDPVTFRSAG